METAAVLVFGTGSIGMRHMRVLANGLGVKALARPTRAERMTDPALRESFDVVDSYATASSKGARAAVIATATGRHLDDAREAVAAGFDLLVEKPLASSAKGLAALDRAARDANRQIYVGCCLRFQTALRLFRERLPEIGKPHHVRIECQSYLPDWRPGTDHRTSYAAHEDEGGVLRDLVHEIDYAMWLFGMPASVTATLGNTGRLGIASEEEADLVWSANGATVSLRLDYLTRPARRIMRATGEHGTLEVDLIAQRVTLARAGETPREEDAKQDRDDMMKAQTAAFLAAVTSGDARNAGDLATFEDGARVLAICDAARRSSAEKKEIAVTNWRDA
jgi:predicted dehydrogenase